MALSRKLRITRASAWHLQLFGFAIFINMLVTSRGFHNELRAVQCTRSQLSPEDLSLSFPSLQSCSAVVYVTVSLGPPMGGAGVIELYRAS